ncbi:uncharacterized protein LOC121381894 [Gigantopelta aegis]|uniref:uncharacterized protein LOC121381894 n=1 Tax=Gigantopelta aegis TaxID=1735272 RepID=UPI001B889A33|nr:uncharacterized protein LOC121381894 [Gigantopelta aegis]
MTSVKTMPSPYGQGKWRTSSDNMSNYTGIVGSRYKPPFVRLDSTGEVKSSGFVSPQQPSFDSEMTCFQKANASVLNFRDLIVEKLVNTNNTKRNLTMSDRHVLIDTDPFSNPVQYNTMPQTRPFMQQPPYGAENRWHPKQPSLPFQQTRFTSNFRVFPCHRFEFYNNIKNTMDIHAIGPCLPQNFMGFQSNPREQNFRNRNKHLPHRKVIKRESVPNPSISYSGQHTSDHGCDNVESPLKSQDVCRSSQRCTIKKDVQCENICGNDQPCLDPETYNVNYGSRQVCSNEIISTGVTMKDTMGNVTSCTADDASNVLKGDSDNTADSLIDDLTNIVLSDVNNVVNKTCLNMEKAKSQEEASVSETSQNACDVLLLRKTCKKGRPSAKKQRKRKRQKAKLSDSSVGAVNFCDINNEILQGSSTAQNEKPSKCQRNTCQQQFGCSAIAFILGLHSKAADAPVDVVDLFSEDDSGDDSDFCDISECDIAASIPQCNLTSVLPQHNKPMLFCVSSSIQPDVDDDTAKLDAINFSWNIQISKHIADARETKRSKKVNFNDDHLVTIHQADRWSRKGPWEDYARDRQRFQRRITESEEILSRVLTPHHRASVFQKHHST